MFCRQLKPLRQQGTIRKIKWKHCAIAIARYLAKSTRIQMQRFILFTFLRSAEALFIEIDEQFAIHRVNEGESASIQSMMDDSWTRTFV